MSKELSTKHKWIIAVAIFLSVVAIILSIITLCSVYPNKDLGFDYLGIIVGMFALLITVLIGWQIFSLINFKEAQNEILELRKESKRMLANTKEYHDKIELDIYKAKAEAQYAIFLSCLMEYTRGESTVFDTSGSLAIQYYCKANDIKQANMIFEMILRMLKAPFNKNMMMSLSFLSQVLINEFNILKPELVNEFKEKFYLAFPERKDFFK